MNCLTSHANAIHIDFSFARIFTDGSGWFPNDTVLRVATWAFVVADLPDEGFAKLAQGFVPDLIQTVLCAEIWAVIAALEWVLETSTPAILCVDNQQVHTTVETFRLGQPPCTSNCHGHDLWSKVPELCEKSVERNLLIKLYPSPFWQVWDDLHKEYEIQKQRCDSLFWLFPTVGQRAQMTKSMH